MFSLGAIAEVVVTLHSTFEIMELLDSDQQVMGQLSQRAFAPGFITALGVAIGRDVRYVDGGDRPYGGSGPE